MNIHIRAQGFELTDRLREHTERRLRFALGWADDRLRQVSICLSDENGPRGGEDKRCRIQIAFPGAPNVVIDDTEADLYVAIDRAADRAGLGGAPAGATTRRSPGLVTSCCRFCRSAPTPNIH